MKSLNANGGGISLGIVQAAVAGSELRWAMHVAQWYALESESLNSFVQIAETRQPQDDPLPFNFTALRWLAGIPVNIDDAMPKETIELRLDGVAIFKIIYLAVPGAFFS